MIINGKMLRIVSMLIVVLLFGCSRYDAAADGGGHRYFTMGEAPLHTQHSLFELFFDDFVPADGEITVGPVELIGDGVLHSGVADYCPINNHIRPVRLVNTHNMYSPLLVEVENMPDDSLRVLIRFSYSHSSDTMVEIVSGTVNIPLVRDSLSLHHRLKLGGQPLNGRTPDDGTSQKIMLDFDFLLM